MSRILCVAGLFAFAFACAPSGLGPDAPDDVDDTAAPEASADTPAETTDTEDTDVPAEAWCGDDVCDNTETPTTCPADCDPVCGDLWCDGDETFTTCPGDCEAVCGDGFCDGETTADCPDDCGTFCGDGVCNGGESTSSCAADCGNPSTGAFCGDGTCEVVEIGICSADCGTPSFCGDGTCDPGENGVCTADCTPSFCGDGSCDTNEAPGTCPSDCGYVWEAEALNHGIGYADGQGWAADTAGYGSDFLVYGPYATSVLPGSHVAEFHLMVDNVTAGNHDVVTLDVYDHPRGQQLAERRVTRHEFNTPFQYQVITVPFTSTPGATLEFRVFWHDTSWVNVDRIEVY